jgi:hypothetical protein
MMQDVSVRFKPHHLQKLNKCDQRRCCGTQKKHKCGNGKGVREWWVLAVDGLMSDGRQRKGGKGINNRREIFDGVGENRGAIERERGCRNRS